MYRLLYPKKRIYTFWNMWNRIYGTFTKCYQLLGLKGIFFVILDSILWPKYNFLAVMYVSVTKFLAIKWSASDECEFYIPYYKYAVFPRFAFILFFSCKLDIREASTSFHAADKESTSERTELRWKESGCLNNLVKQSCPTGLDQIDCYVRQKYTSI